jgi:predicted ATP-binding protein involved in virulence
MQIDRLVLRNFKGFEDFDQRFNKRFTLIVGKNGVGKSSILDALSVAFGAYLLSIPNATSRHIQRDEVRETSQEFDGRLDFIPAYPAVVQAEGTILDPLTSQPHKLEWKRELSNPRGRTSIKDAFAIRALANEAYEAAVAKEAPTLPLLSYYGTGRLWGEPKRMPRKQRPSRFDAYRNSHEPRVSAADLFDWLKRMRLNEFETDRPSPILAAWRKAVESCFDEPVRVNYSPSRERLEITFESKNRTVAYENLSHGQRTILSMVGDIAFKASILNPHLGAEAANSTRGIVLIDEIDLHLHPTWQKLIIPALLKAFPRLQFVATTHSPFVIQSLSEGVMLDMDESELEDRAYNLPIGQIIEDIQKVKDKDRSATYMQKMHSTETYLALVDRLAVSSDSEEITQLERNLDEMERRFQDPALEALMKIERMARLKRRAGE